VSGIVEGAGKGMADERNKEWESGERVKDREWRSEESEKDRKWREGESSKDRDWRTGERLGEEHWRTGEREAGQEWSTGERREGQDWQSGERREGQDWRTKEREAGQGWQSHENELDRQWQRWNADENRKWQTGRDEKRFGHESDMQGNMFEHQNRQLQQRQKHDVKMRLLDAQLRGYMTPGAAYGGNAAGGGLGLGHPARTPSSAQQAQDDLYTHRSVGLQTDSHSSASQQTQDDLYTHRSVGLQTDPQLSVKQDAGTQTFSKSFNSRGDNPPPGTAWAEKQPGPSLKKMKPSPMAAAAQGAIKPAGHSQPSAVNDKQPARDSGYSGTTGKSPEDRLAEGASGGPAGIAAAAIDQFNEDTGRIGYGLGRMI
jgi:hypothetical protein